MKTLHLSIIVIVAVIFFATNYASAQTSQYNFQIWPADPWKAPGYWETIQGKICPTPVPDPNTSPLIKVYFGISGWEASRINASQIVRESNALPSCENPLNITSMRPNYTNTLYPVYAVAQWVQNGTTQTVKSNNTQFLAIEVCTPAYGMDFEKLRYHPGDTVPIKIKSVFSGCMHLPTTAAITVYNSTADGITENVLYNESLQIVNETWFNYTVPEQTNNNGLLYFLERLTYPTSNGAQAKQDLNFLSSDIKKSMSYKPKNFTMWVQPSSIVNGSYTVAITKICPFAPATDDDKGILLNYRITMPNGSQKLLQGGLGSFDNCGTTWDTQTIGANTIGTWSVNATALWMENGTIQKWESKPVNFEVRKPLTNVVNMTKIFDLAKVNQTQIAVDCKFQYECNYGYESLDWSPDGKFIVFTIESSPSVNVWKVDLQTKQSEDLNIPIKTDSLLHLRISPDENSILFFADHVIDSNGNQVPDLYRFDIQEKRLTQLTNSTQTDLVESAVWTPDGNIIYSKSHVENTVATSPTDLWLVDRNGKVINKIYSEPSFFVIYDISKDGKKLLISDSSILDLDTMKTQDIGNTFTNLQNSRFAPNDDLFVYTPGATYSPGGPIYIASTDGYYEQSLQVSNLTPALPVVSPDGKYIVFSTDAANTGEKPEYYGIYLLELTQPVPEFPLAEIVLLISVAILLVFYRIKSISFISNS